MATYLADLVLQKKNLDKKIEELKDIFYVYHSDDVGEELRAILELRQGLLMSINTANEASRIKIGSTEISISVAVLLRKTLEENMEILTRLIEDRECRLDKIDLQKKRDKYHNEFSLLTMAIQRNDLQVVIE